MDSLHTDQRPCRSEMTADSVSILREQHRTRHVQRMSNMTDEQLSLHREQQRNRQRQRRQHMTDTQRATERERQHIRRQNMSDAQRFAERERQRIRYRECTAQAESIDEQLSFHREQQRNRQRQHMTDAQRATERERQRIRRQNMSDAQRSVERERQRIRYRERTTQAESSHLAQQDLTSSVNTRFGNSINSSEMRNRDDVLSYVEHHAQSEVFRSIGHEDHVNVSTSGESIHVSIGDGHERSQHSFTTRRKSDVNESSGSESTIKDRVCKAGNNMCNLNATGESNSLAAKACDVCCPEAGFCRNCSCILCCKSIDWSHGGYSFIKCETTLDENYICGHVAHLDCALRCFMAGTVGGKIGLDVEYYCRCCDNKTNLIQHVIKLIKTCESPDFQDKISEILNMGLCLLRGSEQTKARNLWKHIEVIVAKRKDGSRLGNIMNVEENATSPNAGNKSCGVNEVTMLEPQGIKGKHNDSANTVHSQGETADGRVCIRPGSSNVSMELEDDVDLVLKKLKKSLESGYTVVEQKLYAQKDVLLSLHQQLEAQRSELVKSTTSGNGRSVDAVVANIKNLVKNTEHENTTLRSMMLITNEFQDVLTEQLGRLL